MKNYLSLFLLAFCLFLLSNDGFRVSAAPTDGFTPINLGPNNFQLHWPYDVPRESRYTPINQFNFFLEKFWLWSTDKPFRPDSPTKPRTEMRIAGNDYTSGVRQFEGAFQVPSGTNGVCIFQVFGATGSATTLQLRVYDGNLWIYRNQIVESNIFGRLIKLNVIHDVGNSRVTIFINDQQRAVVGGRGPGTFYFKYGVYAQDGSSNYMESGWRGVRIFRR